MQSVIILNVTYKPFVLSVVMLSVIRLNVVMLSVVAPFLYLAGNRSLEIPSLGFSKVGIGWQGVVTVPLISHSPSLAPLSGNFGNVCIPYNIASYLMFMS